jgi:hypothetical protein
MPILNPIADGYMSDGAGELGLTSTMVAGQIVPFGAPVRSRILLTFDLTPYTGVQLYSARLRLVLIQAFFPDAPHTVYFEEVTKAWVESEFNWDRAAIGDPWAAEGGDFAASPIGETTITNGATVLEMELLTFAMAKRGGHARLGIRLPEISSHSVHFFSCHSRQAALQANWPTLTLTTARACLTTSDVPVTNLSVADSAVTNLTISDVGCAA